MHKDILDCQKVLDTVHTLGKRIQDRFPGSGLYFTCQQLYEVGKKTKEIVEKIEKPNGLFRALVGAFIAITAFFVLYGFSTIKISGNNFSIGEIIQSSEALLNHIVLLGAAIVFLVSIETRSKRKKVVEAVNRLRSIAHVIDSHQLTKDPDTMTHVSLSTKNSPKRDLTPHQLGRYLDYCSELLSLTGKIGFLYVQKFHDPVSVNAVNDLESLTTGMSRKIWQKIMVLKNTYRA